MGKAVKKGFPTFVEGICWSVGRGSKLKFWEDKWVKGKSLKELMARPLWVEELNLTIAEVFQGGHWNWEKISYDLPREIKEQICDIPMQLWGEKEDIMMWKFTRDGEFSTTSAYAQLRPEDTENQPFEGHWIWKLDIWPKITSFLWLCFHDSVPVKQVIAK
nr:putative ribonuclease h protein [Quercus suber]